MIERLVQHEGKVFKVIDATSTTKCRECCLKMHPNCHKFNHLCHDDSTMIFQPVPEKAPAGVAKLGDLVLSKHYKQHGYLLIYRLLATTKRLTFDILWQHEGTIYTGPDDGMYHKYHALNGYEVISRRHMDIKTERIWLLGSRSESSPRSGTMVFESNTKRDKALNEFVVALREWAAFNNGRILDLDCLSEDVPYEIKRGLECLE